MVVVVVAAAARVAPASSCGILVHEPSLPSNVHPAESSGNGSSVNVLAVVVTVV